MTYRSGKCLYQLEVVSPVAGGGSTGGSCLTQGKFRQSNIGGPSVNNTTHTHHHILCLTQVMAGEVRGCQEINRWSIFLHRKHIIIAYRNLYESIQDPIHHTVMYCLMIVLKWSIPGERGDITMKHFLTPLVLLLALHSTHCRRSRAIRWRSLCPWNNLSGLCLSEELYIVSRNVI